MLGTTESNQDGVLMYDAIVIGARCAGSPTAMLLARAGHRVLLLDKATFPSDKLSTHYIQPPGVKALENWGLLDRVIATNAPPITEFRVHLGGVRVPLPPQDGVAYCPRRYLLDSILLDAAREAGAEVRTAFKVDQLLMEADVVTGIRGHGRDEKPVQEMARYVIGAEGHHSLVADSVQAPKYREREALTGGYYSYFSGLEMDAAEVYVSERGGVLAFPTNDGQVCIAAGSAKANFAEYRKDIEAGFFNILDGAPEFAARVRASKREERWMGTVDVPNFFRKPWGPGWALVGDAGYMKDPVTGFGITDAFRDADLLAAALNNVFARRVAAEQALGGFQAKRDEAASPVYDMTLAMASGEMTKMLGG
ncbi:MAG: NAD(P)/FAD-dependent oxidoreductase [Dehalococcoidia bacterium]